MGAQRNTAFPESGRVVPERQDPQIREAITSITPLGRVGLSEDVARVIFFLASDEAAWVTGQIVDATGGLWLST